MPADFVMKTGDFIKFTPMGPETYPLMVAPVALVGTGIKMTVNNMIVCLDGDEHPPILRPPQPYMSGGFTSPGMGTLKIFLAPNNLTVAAQEEGKKLLLKGGVFRAEFTVNAPATSPSGSSDPVAKKFLQCNFITTNTTVKFS